MSNLHIFHISDLHIRHSRIDEYKIVFERTIKEFEKIKTSIQSYDKDHKLLIIITGDIFHSKVFFDGSDVPTFNWFITELEKIALVILIAGNHDTNMNNQNATDLITCMIKDNPLLTKSNVVYFKQSGCYTYENIDFGVISVLDPTSITQIIEFCQKTFRPNTKKIGLFHRQLNNKSGDTKDLLKFIDMFDIVLAGDLHKREIFGSNKQGMYAGPLFQQTIAEDYQCGFLWWSMANYEFSESLKIFMPTNKKWSRLFIPIPNNFGSIKIIYDNFWPIPTSNLPPILRRVQIDVKSGNLEVNNDKLNKDLMNFYKNFGVQKIEHIYFASLTKGERQKLLDKVNNNESIEKNTNIDNLQNDIRLFVKQHKLYSNIDDLLELHESYIQKVRSNDKNKNYWSLLKLEWTNLICYGKNNIIDFTKYNSNDGSIIGILAENKMGKTSIIDILALILYNKHERTKRDMMLNLNNENESAYARATLQVGNDKIVIKCKYFTGKYTCNLLINDFNYTAESNDKTYKILERYIGVYDDFMQINVIKQGEKDYSNRFIKGSSAERRSTIYNMFNLNEYKAIQEKIDNLSYNLSSIHSTMLGCKGQAADTIIQKSKLIKETYDNLEKELIPKKKLISDLEDKIKNYESTSEELNELYNNLLIKIGRIVRKPESLYKYDLINKEILS